MLLQQIYELNFLLNLEYQYRFLVLIIGLEPWRCVLLTVPIQGEGIKYDTIFQLTIHKIP